MSNIERRISNFEGRSVFDIRCWIFDIFVQTSVSTPILVDYGWVREPRVARRVTVA